MASTAPPGVPPFFSGTNLVVAALTHSSPPTCTDIDTYPGRWESEDLVRVAAVSKELRAATTSDHLWEPLLEQFMQEHPFSYEAGFSDQVFPPRIHDERGGSWHPHARDRIARGHVPALVIYNPDAGPWTQFNEATGEVVDLFIPASRESDIMRTCPYDPCGVWLPRPPVLMRCEPCGGLSFESGRLYTEHCISWAHSQMMQPREERLPEEMWDPRCDPKAFAALSLPGRYSALRLHVDTAMAAFNEPLDEAGMENMQSYADFRRNIFEAFSDEDVLERGGWIEYKPDAPAAEVRRQAAEVRRKTAARCTVERVIEAIRSSYLIGPFESWGLCPVDAGSACELLAQPSPQHWWSKWEEGGSGSWRALASDVTGIDFGG
jgi:hypothetical protein